MTHTGLTGIKIFVRPDEQTAFEDLKQDLAAKLNPASAHERHLFDVVLSAAWNVRRCISVEAELQNEANSLGFADAFFDEELGKKLDRIHRYQRQYESSYRRALAELKQLIAARAETTVPASLSAAPRQYPELSPAQPPAATAAPAAVEPAQLPRAA